MKREELVLLKNSELNCLLSNPYQHNKLKYITKPILIDKVIEEFKLRKLTRKKRKKILTDNFLIKCKKWFPNRNISFVYSHGTPSFVKIKEGHKTILILPRSDGKYTLYKTARKKLETVNTITKSTINDLIKSRI